MHILTLFNTLSKTKETFSPLDPAHVKMYVCGPTVYDFAHIGNARPVVVFDVLFRLLQRLYPKITYVRNITDVDDKINTAAIASGESMYTITGCTIQAYHEDMEALYTLPPTVEPRATAHILHMIELIQTLMRKGFAYEAKGHVLFRRKAFEDYGHLSRRTLEDMVNGARVEIAPYKEDPADFVLWKPSTDATPGWESPFGFGRPGWHIECSAMSKAYLGECFDIHGGGIDLVFPHHENEIAQSCAAHGTERMANYWVHNGHVMVDGAKMSKSLGNFLTVRELLKKYDGEVLRLAFLQTHYRQPIDFSYATLDAAKNTLDRFYLALSENHREERNDSLTEPDAAVYHALLEDMNTPLALTYLHKLLKEYHHTKSFEFLDKIKASGGLLGLFNQSPRTYLCGGTFDEACIEALIQKRAEAKKRRDFTHADALRKELEDMGVLLEDLPTGTRWRRGGGL